MKIASWNVNGIRSVATKGFGDWFDNVGADIVCLQEIKATPEQLEEKLKHPKGFHSFWHPAKKPGYSGVAVFSRKEPQNITYGLGQDDIDHEGRVLLLDYGQFVLLNTYFPNSQREHQRLPYKLEFCAKIHDRLDSIVKKGKHVVMCGDYNIAHREIDLKNPKQNMKNAGFLPEERAWMDQFLGSQYIDVFRKFDQRPDQYTWWSYRPTIRERNIGWRLDYFCANQQFADQMKGCQHQPQVLGSDHCPVVLTLKH